MAHAPKNVIDRKGNHRMRVSKRKDGSLNLVGDISAGTEEAFKETRYVEAFALLHSEIDWWMANAYQFYRMGSGTAEGKLWEKMVDEKTYRFKGSAEFLRDVGIITQDQFERLEQFDRLRNKIVHRLVIHSYRPRKSNTVTEGEVQSGFIEGRRLREILKGKSNDLGMNAIIRTAGRRLLASLSPKVGKSPKGEKS